MSISAARNRFRLDARRGTTLIEVVVALSIASVLMGITFSSLSKVSAARSASSARDTYVWMARRARASAIQRGNKVNLVLLPSTASARVVNMKDNTVLDQVDLADEFGVTITGVSGTFTIAFDPRGIGTPASTPTITFTRGAGIASARVQGLGQVEVVQ